MVKVSNREIFSLRGKVAIITGGNGGIGKGIARGFASAGATIVIGARNEDKTARAIQELKNEFDVRLLGVKVDVLQEDSVHAMISQALDSFGQIDILVNNAGISIRKKPQNYTLEEWDKVLNVNLRGALLCSKAAYPAFKAAGRGKIINIGSMLSIFGHSLTAAYAASKGGIVQLTRSLAVAWAPDKIQVNTILPGWINTDLTRNARNAVPDLEEHIKSRTPLRRWGEPDDLAGTAIYLASQASDFVTGVALPVDGGFSIMI